MEVETPQKQSYSIAKSENDNVERILQVFEAQKANLQSLKNTKIKERKQKLKLLKKKVFEYRSKIQEALYQDYKKPAEEADISEIYPVTSEIKHVLSHVDDWAADEHVDTPTTLIGSSAYIQYGPKGNCLVIAPWNYPFYLTISPIVYAIAAGNAVMVKPSEFTPKTTLVLKELLAEVFKENEVAIIQGDHTVSTELLKLKFNHIHFTGSPNVGKIVMEAASKHLTSCTLELGGKSPTIIDDTANLKEAAKKIVWGKYLNEGQTCISPDYILVHQSKKTELIEAMKTEINKRYGTDENARQHNGNLSRIVNAKHFNRVKDLSEDAVNNGAKVAAGAKFDETENYIDPTILTDVSKDSRIMNEEIFGPVLPILTYNTLEEAVQMINEKERPLALYIFSKKNKNIDYIMQHTTAGGTCINETILHITQPNLPFGGINNSGLGKSHGKWGFVDFSNERSVLRQHFTFGMAQLLYPPYNKFSKFVIDFTMKWF